MACFNFGLKPSPFGQLYRAESKCWWYKKGPIFFSTYLVLWRESFETKGVCISTNIMVFQFQMGGPT